MADSDTIFALSTPPGRSALAVFRISGSSARTVLETLTKRACPPPRQASLRNIFDPASREKIDQALVTFFESPATFTGEDVFELSVHGGRSVITAVGRALSGLPSVRSAEPGEFTRRAYQAGKFDLSQAEAIADLIDSETEFQRRQALRLLEGGLGKKAELWRSRLLSISADLESAMDFSDEGDVESLDLAGLAASARGLADELKSELAAGVRSMSLRNGFTVVLAGPPNSGKSTLFNLLAGQDIAIVTEYAGTTRDLLRVDLDLDGVPVTLVDSAGIREAVDAVERIGVERARSAIGSADLVLSLRSADSGTAPLEIEAGGAIAVWSKSDLAGAPPGDWISISAGDPVSIARLIFLVRECAIRTTGDGSQGSLIRDRHSRALVASVEALKRLGELCYSGQIELAAEECRIANAQLGSISGAFGVEDILGEIFSRFCIGK